MYITFIYTYIKLNQKLYFNLKKGNDEKYVSQWSVKTLKFY